MFDFNSAVNHSMGIIEAKTVEQPKKEEEPKKEIRYEEPKIMGIDGDLFMGILLGILIGMFIKG